jgi:PRC-barrel domain protein
VSVIALDLRRRAGIAWGMADHDAPVSFLTLPAGTPVFASDGTEVGTVARVLADSGTAIFDGVIITTGDGYRFVDAPEVARITAGGVRLTIDSAAARALPEPSQGPRVVRVDPRRGVKRSGGVVGSLRRSWDRFTKRP